jgi:hypothetical protein
MQIAVIFVVLVLCSEAQSLRVITEEENNGVNEIIINGGDIENMWIKPHLIPATPDDNHLHISLVDYLIFNSDEYTSNGTKKLVCKTPEAWRCDQSKITSIRCEKKGKDDSFRTTWECISDESKNIASVAIACDRHKDYPDHIRKGSCRIEYRLSREGPTPISDIAKYILSVLYICLIAMSLFVLIDTGIRADKVHTFSAGFIISLFCAEMMKEVLRTSTVPLLAHL